MIHRSFLTHFQLVSALLVRKLFKMGARALLCTKTHFYTIYSQIGDFHDFPWNSVEFHGIILELYGSYRIP